MKNTPLLALGLILCAPLGLFAQNFSGSDDFSVPATSESNWTTTETVGSGAFDVTPGYADFTDEGLASSGTNSISNLWTPNNGSYIANWSVMFDCTISNTMASGESAYWALVLVSSLDNSDYFVLALRKDENNTPFAQGILYTDGSPVDASGSTPSIGGNSAALQVYYTAATHTLTAAYDTGGSSDGYSFTDFWSVDISATDWGMSSSDMFALLVQASHSSTSTADAITTGTFTADNFVANGAAVPEPSTYALLGGLAVLGFCFWRRRVA